MSDKMLRKYVSYVKVTGCSKHKETSRLMNESSEASLIEF